MNFKLFSLALASTVARAATIPTNDITCFSFFGPDGFWDDFQCPGNGVCKKVTGKGFICVDETSEKNSQSQNLWKRVEYLHCGGGWPETDVWYVEECPASTRCNREVGGFCVPKRGANVKVEKRVTMFKCGSGWSWDDPRVVAVCPQGTKCSAESFGYCSQI